MYPRTYWQNEVRNPANTFTVTENADGTKTVARAGTRMEEGTPQDKAHFNNMEEGITDGNMAAAWLAFYLHQIELVDKEYQEKYDADVLGESQTVKLTNTGKYPFNSTINSPVTVALATTRKNLFYDVEATVTAHTGEVGEVHIIDKALNGFKVYYDGAGASATILLRIKGGMS